MGESSVGGNKRSSMEWEMVRPVGGKREMPRQRVEFGTWNNNASGLRKWPQKYTRQPSSAEKRLAASKPK